MPRWLWISYLSLSFGVTATYATHKSEIPIDHDVIARWLELSGAHHMEHPDSTIYYAEKALQLSDSLGIQEGIVQSYLLLARAYFVKQNFQESLEFYHILRDFYWSKDVDGYVEVTNKISFIYGVVGLFDRALRLNRDALKALNESGQENLLKAQVLDYAAIIYREMGLADSAIVYGKRAQSLCREISQENSIHYSIIIANLSLAYCSDNDVTSCLQYASLAESMFKKLDFSGGLAIISFIYGSIAQQSNLNEKALDYFDQTLQGTNDPYTLSRTLIAKAKIYEKRKDWTQSELTLLDALSQARRLGSIPLLVSIYQGLQRITNSYAYALKVDSLNQIKKNILSRENQRHLATTKVEKSPSKFFLAYWILVIGLMISTIIFLLHRYQMIHSIR